MLLIFIGLFLAIVSGLVLVLDKKYDLIWTAEGEDFWVILFACSLIAIIVLGLCAGVAQLDKSEVQLLEKNYNSFTEVIQDDTKPKDATFYMDIKKFNNELEVEQKLAKNPWINWFINQDVLDIEKLPEK